MDISGIEDKILFMYSQGTSTRDIEKTMREMYGIVSVAIIDDGCGCKDIIKGFGLEGMEKRVKMLNGMIEYCSEIKKGLELRQRYHLVRKNTHKRSIRRHTIQIVALLEDYYEE